jgi:hypothetical protein
MKEKRLAEIYTVDNHGKLPLEHAIKNGNTLEFDRIQNDVNRDVYWLGSEKMATIPHSQIVLTHKITRDYDPDLYLKIPFSEDIKTFLFKKQDHSEFGEIVFKENDVLTLLQILKDELSQKKQS